MRSTFSELPDAAARQLKRLSPASIAGLLILVVVLAAAVSVWHSGQQVRTVKNASQTKLPPLEPLIATDNKLLEKYIKDYGVDKTIAHIKTLGIDCHQRSHTVGRLTYGISGNKAFGTMNSECMSGYTHGVTEAYFHEHGTANLNDSLDLICQGMQRGFYAHQCFHGVGHGLMAFNDYDLPATLEQCDTLPRIGTSVESCHSGVFMENVVGAISVEDAKTKSDPGQYHSSEWLSGDLLYPCTAVDTKYKNSCYGFQSSRMLQIAPFDFARIAGACAGIEPYYQYTCFLSMGRDVSNLNGFNYSQIETHCNLSPSGQLLSACIIGASQDKFWHESEQDKALGLCKALQADASKRLCYTTLSDRAREIIPTAGGSRGFCAKYESDYQLLCEVKL